MNEGQVVREYTVCISNQKVSGASNKTLDGRKGTGKEDTIMKCRLQSKLCRIQINYFERWQFNRVHPWQT